MWCDSLSVVCKLLRQSQTDGDLGERAEACKASIGMLKHGFPVFVPLFEHSIIHLDPLQGIRQLVDQLCVVDEHA
jgi:hypothetical protein